MPADRLTNAKVVAGLSPSARRARYPGAGSPSAASSSGRNARFAPRQRDDGATPPQRVTIDGKRPPRVHPAAVAVAVQLIDAAIVLIAGVASFALRWEGPWPRPLLSATIAALVLALMLRGLTAVSQHRDWQRWSLSQSVVGAIVHMLAAFGFALIAAVAVFQPGPAARAPLVDWLVCWAAMAAAGIGVARVVLSGLHARWHKTGRLKQLVAVYGTGDLAERLVERLRACGETIEIVGVFDDRTGRNVVGAGLRALPHGTTRDLVDLSQLLEIDRIVVALPHSAEKRLLEILRKLHKMPVEISLAPDMVGFNVPTEDREDFGGLPLLDVYGKPLTFRQNLAKTAFDRLTAAFAPRPAGR